MNGRIRNGLKFALTVSTYTLVVAVLVHLGIDIRDWEFWIIALGMFTMHII